MLRRLLRRHVSEQVGARWKTAEAIERAMGTPIEPDKVRAVLAMRGHMLSKHQRDAAEAWLADVVIEKGR